MSEFSVRRPIAVLMICLGLTALGVISFQKTPLQLMPKVEVPEMTIITELKGAAPTEVEEAITIPLERSIATVPGLIETSSVSERGRSEVQLKFKNNINILDTLNLLRDRADSAGLPEATGKPKIQRAQSGTGAALRLGIEPVGDQNPQQLQEELRAGLIRDLEQISGVAVVLLAGASERQLEIELDPLLTNALGLQAAQIATVIRAQNRSQSGGEVELEGQKISVRVGDRLRSVSDLMAAVVHVDQHRIIRLSDVGKVIETRVDLGPRVRINGRSGFEIEIMRESQANAVRVNDMIREEIERAGKHTESRYRMHITWDQGRQIQQALDGVFGAVITGGILTAFAIFVFLQSLWSTFVVSIVIPIALLLTLIMMHFAGMSFNLMSLSGLALGVGMLVDNAIVVLESIKQRQLTSDDQQEAAIWGTRRVMGAVFSSTMSNVAVFGPLIFIEGKIGQIFKDISLAIVFSNFAALFAALLVVPALCGLRRGTRRVPIREISFTSWLLERWPAVREEPTGSAHWITRLNRQFRLLGKSYLGALTFAVQGLRFVLSVSLHQTIKALQFVSQRCAQILTPVQSTSNWLVFQLEQFFDRAIPWAMRSSRLVFLGTAGITLFAALIFSRMGSELFPDAGASRFEYELRVSPGTIVDRAAEEMGVLERSVSQIEGVTGTTLKIGTNGSHTGRLVALSTEEKGEATAKRLTELFARNPGFEIRRLKESLVGAGLPVEILVFGEQEDLLRTQVQRVVKKLREIPGLIEVQSSLRPTIREVDVAFDRRKLEAYQQDPSQWAATLKPHFQTQSAGLLTIPSGDLPVVVRLPAHSMNHLDRISDLFQNVDDKRIYLGEIADVGLRWVSSSIERQDRRRVARVVAGLEDLDLEGATALIRKSLQTEPDLVWMMGGQEKERQATQRSLAIAIGLSIFLIYLILASQFENLSQPFLVLLAIPLCLVGVVLFLLTSGINVSALVLVGFVILVGTSVNTSIILVDTANQFVREGMQAGEACRRAALQRLRPILMSSGASIVGLIPLALKLSEGSASQQPLAVTMIGGLLSSTILTLILLPLVYERLQTKAGLT